jgi:hypothetical protein
MCSSYFSKFQCFGWLADVGWCNSTGSWSIEALLCSAPALV